MKSITRFIADDEQHERDHGGIVQCFNGEENTIYEAYFMFAMKEVDLRRRGS